MKFVLFVTLIWSILDSGWSITDEDLIRIEVGLSHIQILTNEMENLRNENQAGHSKIQVLTTKVEVLENENHELRQFKAEQLTINKRQEELNTQLKATCQGGNNLMTDQGLSQNTTIEERVTILEGEMTIVQNDIIEVKGDVDFLFDEQVIDDERLFSLEERTLILEQDTDALDERVEVLEANGGGGGNITALEERVETLEGTAAEHEADIEDLNSATSNLDGRMETLEGETSELETRLTAAESIIEDLSNITSNLDGRVETLEGETNELETRLTTAETMIEDLQTTDVELDSRISDLEEGGETIIAFRAVMNNDDNDNIPVDSTVIFSEVQLNEGNGYDPTTGVFTVPSGGEGYYYFSTHFTVQASGRAKIDIRVNDVIVCTMYEDNSVTADPSAGGCNTCIFLSEGDEVKNVYWQGGDSRPVYELESGVYNGFTGFRI